MSSAMAAPSAPSALPSGPVYESHGFISAYGAADIERIISSGGADAADSDALVADAHAAAVVAGEKSADGMSSASHTAPGSRDERVEKEDAPPPQQAAHAGLEAGAGGDEAGEAASWSRWMQQDISHDAASLPLAWQALLTGMVDALIYSRSAVWTGFQTGNMVQFSQNIAQYMLPGAPKFALLTTERIISICAFLLGSFVGARGGRRFGDRVRAWQMGSAAIQSLVLWGAAGILLSRPEDEEPSFRYWPGIIALTAFSMGMQSIAAQKLVSPSFATTVAFTATLSQIASDPYLFALTLSPFERLRKGGSKKPGMLGRDRRLLAIAALCTGAGVAECLLFSNAGLRGGVAIAAGFKGVQALLWLFPKGEEPKPLKKA